MRRRIREWRESPYRFIKSKEVRDDDGFITDYTWWYDERDGIHFFMFGDRDIYRPNRDYADWECDSYEEAEEWFYNYGTEEYIDDRFDEDYKRGLINYYKIIYGEGKPGEKEEIVKGEYRDVVRTAARRANGWGYDIVKMDVNESLKEDRDNKFWAILCTDKETGKQYYDDVFDNKEYAHYYAALNRRDYPHYGYGDFTFSVVPMSEDEYNRDVLASQRELRKLILQRSKDRKSRSLRDVVNRAVERLDKDSSLDDIKYTIVDELDDAFDNWSEKDYSNVFDDVITAINGHNGPFIEPINK